MAGFGGAIKLTGEREYRTAVSEITRSVKELSAQMAAQVAAFNASGQSEKDAEESTAELSETLEEQKKALAAQTAALKNDEKALEDANNKHKDLEKQLKSETDKLEDIGKTLGTTSNEYKAQEKVVSALAKEEAAAAKDVDRLDKSVSKSRVTVLQTEQACSNTEKAIKDVGKAAEDSGKKADKGSQGFTVFKGVLANLATDAIEAGINGLKRLGQTALNIGKQALESYANYEQLKGGVETLFGEDAAQTVIDNANKAFKTAGLSANDYLDTVTSFSAALLKSLGGDTEKAAQVADKAITDMADNANKMGTSIDSIQNAYAGFAKGNFTIDLMSVA